MSDNSQRSIHVYLEKSEVQERIWRKMQTARTQATVTISRAARLYGFRESQLREWEKRGLVQTERSLLSQEGNTGHRQYTPAELDKLAIIRELIDQGYAPTDIPLDVDKIWSMLVGTKYNHTQEADKALFKLHQSHKDDRSLLIDRRIGEMDRQEFWRYFVTQVMRILLMLMCEDMPETSAGLILPLEELYIARTLHECSFDKLPEKPGLSLVGWQGRTRSFYTFLTDKPDFEYPTDFRVCPLIDPETRKANVQIFPAQERVLDNVLLVVQRDTRPLSLSPRLLQTARCLLGLLYERVETWYPCFAEGTHDWLYQTQDLEQTSRVAGDMLFNALLERIVELGGYDEQGQSRWHFCVLYVAKDSTLPIQQQVLIAYAQTRNSPYEIGVTVVDPAQTNSLSQKALQSGQVIRFNRVYFGETATTISATVSHDLAVDMLGREQSTRSALAIPIIGGQRTAIGALYITAQKPQAFTDDDLAMLRILSRMLEEMLLTAQGRRQIVGKLGNFIDEPVMVDPAFRWLKSEGEFVEQIEAFLTSLQAEGVEEENYQQELAILAIDIDHQTRLASKYGNQVAKNLSQQVGQRIRNYIRSMHATESLTHVNVFRAGADKCYLLFNGYMLKDVQNQAKLLKEMLKEGPYRLYPLHAAPGKPVLTESLIELTDITVHIGISSFYWKKLSELLQRYPFDYAVVRVRMLVAERIEEALSRGKGGDSIFTWDHEIWGYRRLE